MGQGLHTKMIQIAAQELGVPVDSVHVAETATDKVANTSATAASASSDLNGMAVLNACKDINARLASYRQANPELSFAEIVHKAYFDRVNLSANGFYKTPEIWSEFDPKIRGQLFYYFTQGAAVSQVEVDTLTGDHVVQHTSIVMDVGQSLVR